jgi:hypothetical protein
MALFTFVLDYKGGTYISQVSARTLKQATVKWAEGLEVEEMYGLGAASKIKLIREMKGDEDKPALLNGLKNVWCQTSLIRGRGALINIIKTSA